MVSLPSQISALCALATRSPCICSRLQVALGLRPKCPGCSIIRTSLTVVLMVSLPHNGSLCHLRWQQPTGLALPSAPQGTRFLPVPKALCRSIFSKRCERPKGARNAAFPKNRGFQRSGSLFFNRPPCIGKNAYFPASAAAFSAAMMPQVAHMEWLMPPKLILPRMLLGPRISPASDRPVITVPSSRCR